VGRIMRKHDPTEGLVYGGIFASASQQWFKVKVKIIIVYKNQCK
jgi:hypothetical protein